MHGDPYNQPRAAPPGPAKGDVPGLGPLLKSADLLQGQKTIAIEHNGAVYWLQATRQGKLILTK